MTAAISSPAGLTPTQENRPSAASTVQAAFQQGLTPALINAMQPPENELLSRFTTSAVDPLIPEKTSMRTLINPAGPSIEQMNSIRTMMKEMSFNSFRDFFVKHKELQEDDE